MTENIFALTGKKALITGASQGIGKAVALGLAEFGADVFIHCAHNLEQARGAAALAEAFGVRAYSGLADFAQAGAAEKLYRQAAGSLGRVDILILNASVQIRKNWREITGEEYDKQMKINFQTSLELIQLFAPGMVEQKWGRIVTMGSVQQYKPHPEMLVYAASKDAQMSMVKNLALQLAKTGITVNNIAPGVIETGRNTQALSDKAYYQKVLEKIPTGVIARPEDLVGAAVFLCSQAGRYLTGVDLPVDGGMHL